MIYQFTVQGWPKAQPRCKTRPGGVYTPKVAEGWKALITLEARKHAPQKPHLGPVILLITCVMPRPRAHYRTNGQLRDDAPIPYIIKPDWENLGKGAQDTLTRVGFWKDDCQVYDGRLVKIYGDGKPFTSFWINCI